MTTTAPFSVMQEGTSGDISSGPGQLGRTVFMNSVGTFLNQETDFDAYYYRYSIEITTSILFTLAPIDSGVYRGYTFILHNRATSVGFILVSYTTYSFAPTAKVIQIQPGEAYIFTAELFNGSVDIWVVNRFLLTGLYVQNTVFVDDIYGDDATGEFERSDLPFKTIGAGATVMADNTIMFVRPGIYSETSTVTVPRKCEIYFQAGAQLTSTAAAIFTTTSATADFSILGSGVIIGNQNTIFTTSSPQNSDADIIEALRIENCVDILAKNCFIYEVVNTAATSGVVQDISEGGFINNIYFRGAGALGVFQAIGARASLPKLYVDYIDTDTQIAYLLIGGSFYIGYIEVATSIKLVQAQNTSFSIGTINAPNLSFSLQGGLNVNFRIGTLNFGYGIPLGSTFLVDAYAYIDNFNQTMATGGVIPFGGNNFLYIDNANIVDGMDVGTGLNTTFAINKLTYTENGSLGAIINCKSCVVRINTMTVNGGSAFYINSSPASSFPGLVAQVQKLYLNGATITRGNMDFSAINIASVVCVGTGVEYLSANGGEALVINDLVATNILAMFDSTASSTTKTQLYFNRLELPALISSTTNQSGLTIVGDYLTTTNVAITSGGSSSPRNWYIHVKKITCPQLFVCSVGPIAQDNVYLYCKEMSCTAIAIDMTNVATSELNISGRIITTAATVIDLATTTISALRFIRASLINTGAGSPVARSGTAIVPQNHGPLMVRVAIPASVFSSTIGSATLINPSYS